MKNLSVSQGTQTTTKPVRPFVQTAATSVKGLERSTSPYFSHKRTAKKCSEETQEAVSSLERELGSHDLGVSGSLCKRRRKEKKKKRKKKRGKKTERKKKEKKKKENKSGVR